ncbi:MAG: 16S rRNA (guanine(966)-N(2))-methyltransferase RsmD [Chloroflexi bacterium]|nr:16S rRNA (guanine(966)-N(2))-methyltransferase RsmD [Chloroflexota bacterium]
MRVIAGTARGHTLKAPPGATTRPTSDYVRGAIFNLLENIARRWSRVLDLYAGSGALGIEALSRGAAWADFVEQDPRACRVIKENLAATHLGESAAVYCTSVRRDLGFLTESYDIIFVDPPYFDAAAYEVLTELAGSRLVWPGTILVVEHSSRVRLDGPDGGFCLIRERRYGDTTVSLYGREEGGDRADRDLPRDL